MKTMSTVLPGGTVLLGSRVSCDGFAFNRPTCVLTHIHDDHIGGFSTSLGLQDPILMLDPTRELLYSMKGRQSLQIRKNLLAVKARQPYKAHGDSVTLLGANHILG